MPLTEDDVFMPVDANNVFLSPEEERELALDMTAEEADRIRNAYYYAKQFGISPDLAYDLEPELNRQITGKERMTEQPRGIVSKTKRAWERGGEAVDLDFLWFDVWRNKKSREEAEKLDAEFQQRWAKNPIEAANWAENIWLKTVSIVHPMASGTAKGITYGVIGAGIAGVLGQAGPQAALPEEVGTMPTGFKIGHTYGTLSYWSQQGTGAIYREALKQGLDDKTAKLVAAIGGPLYGAVEFSQVQRLVPGLGNVKKSIVDIGAKYIETVGWETFEESVQKGIEQGIIYVGKILKGQVRISDVPGDIKNLVVGMMDEGVEAMGPMTLLASGGPAVGIVEVGIEEMKPKTGKVPPVIPVEPAPEVVEKPPEPTPEAQPPAEVAPTPQKEALPVTERPEAPERVEAVPEEVTKAEEKELEAEAAEIVKPHLYIGNVTRRMKEKFAEVFKRQPEEVKGFTEEGFPTKRTDIEMTRGEAEAYLTYLEQDLTERLENNQVRTENELAWANADWGDIKALRETLGLEKVKRPFKVIRAKKHKMVVIKDTKSRLWAAVERGRLDASNMTVGEVLAATMRKARKAAKVSWAAARRELRAQLRAKREAKKRLNKAIKALQAPISKSVDFFYREAIEALTTGIDLARRSEKTLAERQGTREFLERVPEKAKDIPVDLIKRTYLRPLNDFTIAELEEMVAARQELEKQGKLKRRLKEKPKLERRKKNIAALLERTKKVKPPRRDPNLPRTRASEAPGMGHTLLEAVWWSWTPARLFDMLDGRMNFRGLWHRLFMDTKKKANREYIAKSTERRNAFKQAMKERGLSIWGLSKTVVIGGARFSRDELMGIYALSKNPLGKLAIYYGNNLTGNRIQTAIDQLTDAERSMADWIIAEYAEHYDRLRQSVIEQLNRDMGREAFYVAMRRKGIDFETTEQELMAALLQREQLRRHNVEHGFSIERKDISPEFQKPVRLELLGVWQEQIEKQERFIALGPVVREMNKILGNREIRTAVEQRFGRELLKLLDGYVSAVANPYVYRQFGRIEKMSGKLRRNVAIVYLAYNALTMAKQLPSVLLYLPEAGPSHLLASAIDFALDPIAMIQKVRQLDPETAKRSIERELQELQSMPNAQYIRRQIGQYGMEGIYFFDMIARTIGWNAVYEREMQEHGNQQEAVTQASNATTRTQPAARAEDIPAMYRTSEFLNWFTMFTNQLNKIFNIASYDIPSYVKNQDYAKTALGTSAMAVVSLLIWSITHRSLPDEPDDWIEAVGEQALNALPMIGKSIMAARMGWKRRHAAFNAIAGVEKGIKKGKMTPAQMLMVAEGIALLIGVPFIGPKRIAEVAITGEPGRVFGRKKEETQQAPMRRRTSVRRRSVRRTGR